MTAHDHKTQGRRPRGVLDPRWEEELRAGQDADGGAGSVEADLAVVHLLRHARAPEPPGDAGLEDVWAEIEAQTRPVPWWRRPWLVWGTTAVAATAAAALVIVLPGAPSPEESGPGDPALRVAEAESPAALLEQQFEMLAPSARAELERTVDVSRGTMRSELLSMATASRKTAGGAP